MESISILMACPMNPYLETELSKRFNLHRFWELADKPLFLSRLDHPSEPSSTPSRLSRLFPASASALTRSISGSAGKKGIRVTNTPNVLTDDVADLAIGLCLAILRRMCESDRNVWWAWKKGKYKLTTKFTGKTVDWPEKNRNSDSDES